ncbi:MAG: hypothetical protein CUN55_06400 [Phototrophicales bacterium]|nr:MAG: hypothetical protein CUN55_06400 [Phototrophicales bacterium]
MTDYNFYQDASDAKPKREPLTGYALSIAIAVALFALTFLEYFVATTDDLPIFSSNLIPLVVIALVKAALIINYYMHITRIWSLNEDGH